MKKSLYVLFLLVVIVVCFPVRPKAYIDPGMGSIIIQSIGVAVVAVSGFFVVFKNRIFAFFKKDKANTVDVDDFDNDDIDNDDN